MHNSLVVWLDCRGVMQDHDLGLKLPNRCGLDLTVYKDHSLTEVVSLKLMLLDQ